MTYLGGENWGLTSKPTSPTTPTNKYFLFYIFIWYMQGVYHKEIPTHVGFFTHIPTHIPTHIDFFTHKPSQKTNNYINLEVCLKYLHVPNVPTVPTKNILCWYTQGISYNLYPQSVPTRIHNGLNDQ